MTHTVSGTVAALGARDPKSSPGTTAAVVLAAGAGSRFRAGGAAHKLLARLGDRPIVALALEHAAAAGLDETVVVVGAVDLVAAGVVPAGVTVVENPRWAEGQATSLQAALAHAARRGHGAVVVGLGDQPFVPPEAWRAVAAATATPIAVATYDGQRRNPVRLAREMWPLVPADGDEGARSLLRGKPELVREVPCPGHPADIDTVEDLQAWS